MEIKNEIPSITKLAKTAAFTTVGNKIANVSDLVKKADYNSKISEMEKILLLLIIISWQVNTWYKDNIKKLVNEYDLNEKIKTLAKKEVIKTLATKIELRAEQDK